MTTPQELEAKFWETLGTDMTMMVGLDGVEDGHARPMTAQFDGTSGPIWFFTSTDNGIVQALGGGREMGGAQALSGSQALGGGQAMSGGQTAGAGQTGANGKANRAIATFASKDHEVFATVHGALSVSHDRAVIEQFWSPFIAAWYRGGKDDPKLVLLRLDAGEGEIWLNERSVFAGVKLLLGIDPKTDYKDKVARVNLA